MWSAWAFGYSKKCKFCLTFSTLLVLGHPVLFVFSIRSIFKKWIIRYSLNFHKQIYSVFGIWSIFTIRCNSETGSGVKMDMTRGMFNNKPVTDIESFVQLGDGKVVTGREEHEDSLKPFIGCSKITAIFFYSWQLIE